MNYFSSKSDQKMPEDFPKLIAFYLPQFHPVPENDTWWGKGFTEWTNVTKARPLFGGHYQPRLPADLGFYDLRLPEVREAQAELARQYGIHGFCYHYYFFDGGKRLLERPLQEVLATGKPDFPFCICWANENWTRRWDGQERDVLMHQSHSPENNLAFIRSVIPYFQDPRYIRVDGRPLLVIYRTTLIPDMPRTIDLWRDELAKHGLPPPYLIAVESHDVTGEWAVASGFDAVCEFPPHKCPESTRIDSSMLRQNKSFMGPLFDYEKVVQAFVERPKAAYTRHRCVTLGWDNTPRKGKDGLVMMNFSLKAYHRWLSAMREEAQTTMIGDQRFLFVNAWNEWAEGTYLEPDRLYGHAYLEATRAAMLGQPFSQGIDGVGHAQAATTIEQPVETRQSLKNPELSTLSADEANPVVAANGKPHRRRLISISMVGNEADIVEAFVRENLRFVDHMLIADHNSRDGTQEILEHLAEEGLPITITRINDDEFAQQTVTDQLIGRAIEFGSDWIVPLDADEFIDAVDRGAFEEDLIRLGLTHGRVAWLNHVPTVLDDASEINPLRRIRHVYAYPATSPEINPWVWKTIINARLLRPYLDRYGLVKGNHFVAFRDTHKPSMQPATIMDCTRRRHFPARSFAQLALKTGLGMFNQRLSSGSNAIGGFHQRQALERVMRGDQSLETLQFATRRYLDIERIDDEALVDTPIVSNPYPVSCDIQFSHFGKPALSVLLNWIQGSASNEAESYLGKSTYPAKAGPEGQSSRRPVEPVWKTHLSGGADSFIEYYHDNPRREIFELITTAPRALLDVGCAGGATARLVKEKYPDCRCVGIELNSKAAALAATRMDKVISASVEELCVPNEDLPAQAFDVIVMADVLEHLYNPWKVLEKFRPLLSKEGRIIASLPNIFNLQIFERLASGTWEYDKDGILDITHLRFFTPPDMRAMFEEAGYEIELMKGIPHPKEALPVAQRDGLFGVNMEHVQLRNLHPGLVDHLTHIQILIVARASASS